LIQIITNSNLFLLFLSNNIIGNYNNPNFHSEDQNKLEIPGDGSICHTVCIASCDMRIEK